VKIAILLLALSGVAHANGTPTPVPVAPQQSQGQSQTVFQQASSDANAAAAAAAKASAQSVSTASGGAGGANSLGDVAPSQSITGEQSDYNSLSLVLPSLASTPQMAAIAGCAPQITQGATGFLFGAFSNANAVTDTTHCTLMGLRNVKVAQCQYGAAQQIEDLLTKKLLPDYVASAVRFPDLTPAECAALKAPPKPEVIVREVIKEVRVEVPAPIVVPPKPPAKKVAKPCPAGQIPACKAV